MVGEGEGEVVCAEGGNKPPRAKLFPDSTLFSLPAVRSQRGGCASDKPSPPDLHLQPRYLTHALCLILCRSATTSPTIQALQESTIHTTSSVLLETQHQPTPLRPPPARSAVKPYIRTSEPKPPESRSTPVCRRPTPQIRPTSLNMLARRQIP